MTALIGVVRHWYCPNCKKEDTTNEPLPHVRFHPCPKYRGMSMPMVAKGTKAKVVPHKREDYTGPNPLVPDVSPGARPGAMVRAIPRFMSIVTTRDNGQDVVVNAPTAVASVSAGGSR